MNTKTRDPLAVLKDYSAQHGIPDDFDEAIAQVEELVELARQCVPDLADSTLDGHLSRYDLLREALAAFTPGQDSASAYVGFCPYCAEYECDDTCPGPSHQEEKRHDSGYIQS